MPIKEDPKEESAKKADTDFVSKDGDAEYLAKFDDLVSEVHLSLHIESSTK